MNEYVIAKCLSWETKNWSTMRKDGLLIVSSDKKPLLNAELQKSEPFIDLFSPLWAKFLCIFFPLLIHCDCIGKYLTRLLYRFTSLTQIYFYSTNFPIFWFPIPSFKTAYFLKRNNIVQYIMLALICLCYCDNVIFLILKTKCSFYSLTWCHLSLYSAMDFLINRKLFIPILVYALV